jgi:hypothetical protein
MGEFSDRLKVVQERGNLNQSDLCRWFGRPYGTVRFWVKGFTEPASWANYAYVYKQLEELETLVALANKHDQPLVPLALGTHDHAAYFVRLMNERGNGGLPQKHITE